MATKLIPCPFCRSTKIKIEELPGDKPLFHAKCLNLNCKAEGPLRASWADATEAWNTRPESKSGDGNR